MTADTVDTNAGSGEEAVPTSMFMAIVQEIFYSPMNLALVAIIAFLVYKIIKDRIEVPSVGSQKPPEPELPKLRRDFTVAELRQFDGNQPDGRVLVAVNGNVFDVTRGKRFYGPGGPYASFAGRDASRNLATFSVAANDKDEYDDLSDLSPMEMDSVREWEMQFKEKYDLVGKLLRKGGPYASFAGRDASRNLATFSVAANDKDEYDDLSDLSPMEMDSVREWEMQFKEKYDLVGKLLRKGEQPTNYEDEEDDTDKDTKANDTPTNTATTTSNAAATGGNTTTTSPDSKSSTLASHSTDSEGLRKREVTSTTEEVK